MSRNATSNNNSQINRLLLIFAGAALAAVTFSACGHDNNGGGPLPAGGPAIAGPMANDCLQPIDESAPVYQSAPYANYGIQPYRWSHQSHRGPDGGYHEGGRGHGGRNAYISSGPFLQEFPSSGLCGCGPQMLPTCGPQGLTCVPTTGINGNYQYSTWGYQGGQFVPGSPIPAPGYGGGGCASSVAQMCTVGQSNPVTGAYCQPIGNGSGFGVWVQPM